MNPPSLTSPSEAIEPRISDEEVDDLLAQAEDLSAEIVKGVSAEETEEAPPAVVPVEQTQPGDGEFKDVSDTAQSETSDEHADGELKDLLNDPDLASPRGEPDSPRREAPPPVPEPGTLQGGASAAEPAEEISLPSLPSAEDESPTKEVVPDNNDDDDVAKENPPPEQDQPEPTKVRAKPITQRLATIPRSALSVVKTGPIAFVNTILKGIIVLDRPFAGLPTHIKRTLGIAAIAIILTGIAVWMLPALLDRNPFAEMTPYTATGG